MYGDQPKYAVSGPGGDGSRDRGRTERIIRAEPRRPVQRYTRSPILNH